MAILSDKLPTNVPGRFYVDASCVDCGMCPDTAPLVFRRDHVSGQSYVWQQPTTAAQIALAGEAREGCPTESIGEEGLGD